MKMTFLFSRPPELQKTLVKMQMYILFIMVNKGKNFKTWGWGEGKRSTVVFISRPHPPQSQSLSLSWQTNSQTILFEIFSRLRDNPMLLWR